MEAKRNRFLIVTIFLSIFFVKMVISVAPVFVSQIDKDVISNVIMQVEVEHGEHETGKTMKFDVKITDHFHVNNAYVPLRYHFDVSNSFLEHFKRYLDPFHPAVPTPPPNLV